MLFMLQSAACATRSAIPMMCPADFVMRTSGQPACAPGGCCRGGKHEGGRLGQGVRQIIQTAGGSMATSWTMTSMWPV